jgi:hypothetical protein
MIKTYINGITTAKGWLTPAIIPPPFFTSGAFYRLNIPDPPSDVDPIAIIYYNNANQVTAIYNLSSGTCRFNGTYWEVKGKVFEIPSQKIKIIFGQTSTNVEPFFEYKIVNQDHAVLRISIDLEGGKFSNNVVTKTFVLGYDETRTEIIHLDSSPGYCYIKPKITEVISFALTI